MLVDIILFSVNEKTAEILKTEKGAYGEKTQDSNSRR